MMVFLSTFSHSERFLITAPITLKKDQISSQVNEIARGVRSILGSQAGSSLVAGTSLESLYLLTERTVLNNNQEAESLYERIKMEMERAIGSIASSLRAGPSNETIAASMSWLQQLEMAWQSWCSKATLVGSVLTLLNQGYVLEQPGLLSLWDLSLDLFLHSIISDEGLQSSAIASIVICVNGERCVH
jgi:hypothetical protein